MHYYFAYCVFFLFLRCDLRIFHFKSALPVRRNGLHESTLQIIDDMIMLIIHLNQYHHQIDQMGSYMWGVGCGGVGGGNIL